MEVTQRTISSKRKKERKNSELIKVLACKQKLRDTCNFLQTLNLPSLVKASLEGQREKRTEVCE